MYRAINHSINKLALLSTSLSKLEEFDSVSALGTKSWLVDCSQPDGKMSFTNFFVLVQQIYLPVHIWGRAVASVPTKFQSNTATQLETEVGATIFNVFISWYTDKELKRQKYNFI